MRHKGGVNRIKTRTKNVYEFHSQIVKFITSNLNYFWSFLYRSPQFLYIPIYIINLIKIMKLNELNSLTKKSIKFELKELRTKLRIFWFFW